MAGESGAAGEFTAADKTGAAGVQSTTSDGALAGRSAARHASRQRDVDDDDEQLAAYNAYLAKLGEAESRSGAPRSG